MIYIDSLKECTPKKGWRWTSYCHMFADSLDELHEFASKIGMKKTWFQNGRLPHYDLTAKRRELALSLGAQEVPLEWVKNKLRERK
jgi:hypothetical protein